jgi:hypothetical protein
MEELREPFGREVHCETRGRQSLGRRSPEQCLEISLRLLEVELR